MLFAKTILKITQTHSPQDTLNLKTIHDQEYVILNIFKVNNN